MGSSQGLIGTAKNEEGRRLQSGEKDQWLWGGTTRRVFIVMEGNAKEFKKNRGGKARGERGTGLKGTFGNKQKKKPR